MELATAYIKDKGRGAVIGGKEWHNLSRKKFFYEV